jgi:hypothetical protein
VISDGGILIARTDGRSWHGYFLRCTEAEKSSVSFLAECDSKGIGKVHGPLDWKCPEIADISQSRYVRSIKLSLHGPDASKFTLEYRGGLSALAKPGDLPPGPPRDTGWKKEGEWCGDLTEDDRKLPRPLWLSEISVKILRKP